MANDLAVGAPGALETAVNSAANYARNSKAAATLKAYAADWRHFEIWCSSVGCQPLPAHWGQVAAYLAALARAGMRIKTIERRTAAIRHYHRQAGHENPADHEGVRATLQGIRRSLGSASTKKQALTAELLSRAVRKIPNTLQGARDLALLLIGFSAALRRSELVDLNVNDIARHPKGLVLTLRKSKTDQAGAGIVKAIPYGHRLKPVAALDHWLAYAQISEGPIFRGVRHGKVLPTRLCDRQVAEIVKRVAQRAGLDPKLFSGHSLRSGFITSASNAGAELATIAKHAGHAKLDTTLGYVQVADAFRDHAGKRFL